MSTIRVLQQLEKDQNDVPENDGFMNYILSLPSQIKKSETGKLISRGIKWSKLKFVKLMKYGGKATWILATTALLTIIPFIIETEREQMTLEIEALQVESLRAQGYTNDQIKQAGLTLESTLDKGKSE